MIEHINPANGGHYIPSHAQMLGGPRHGERAQGYFLAGGKPPRRIDAMGGVYVLSPLSDPFGPVGAIYVWKAA